MTSKAHNSESLLNRKTPKHHPRGSSTSTVRESFARHIEDTRFPRATDVVEIDGPDDTATLGDLARRLWSCGWILPHDCCDVLEIPSGSTYAKAARLILSESR